MPTQESVFRHFGVMLDCSRNAVMRPEAVCRFLDTIVPLGYNTLMLYTEDTYEIDGQPYFGHGRGRYSREELKRIDAYAASKGVELIPCIQTLAHLNALMQWPVYCAIRDTDDILLAEDERVYALIDSMFATLAECFTSRTVNVGMDEAHNLGLGRYLEQHGYKNRTEILLRHVQRVAKIAEKYGFTMCMWGDMFFRLAGGKQATADAVQGKIPHNVRLIYWDYYSQDKAHYDDWIDAYKPLSRELWFAGGAWRWNGFAPRNNFSIDACHASIASCREHGIEDVIITAWGDNGAECPIMAVLPTLYAAAQFARGNDDMDSIRAGFEAAYNCRMEDYLLLELPENPGDILANPEKYLLYNDCFMGKFDSLLSPEVAAGYAAHAKRLLPMTQHPQFGYLFETARRLCLVLAKKADLGCRTRAAYLAGDHAVLAALVPEYSETQRLLDSFTAAFEKQWMAENKPHGFDVQDIRLGGLARRLLHCRDRLQQYLDGDIERIEELEEPVLDPVCRPEAPKGTLNFNNWRDTVTCNVL